MTSSSRSTEQQLEHPSTSDRPSVHGRQSALPEAPQTEPAVIVSWDLFWEYQSLQWRQHDVYSCWCKLVILIGNLFTRSYSGQAELKPNVLRVQSTAFVAFWVVAATLWLIKREPCIYSRMRSGILLLHWVLIGSLVYWSLPLFNGSSAEGSSVVFDNPLLAVPQQVLGLLFNSGLMWCLMGTLMHRLPWQQVVLPNVVYVACVSWTWTRPFCSSLLAGYHTTCSGDSSLAGSSCSWAGPAQGILELLSHMALALDFLLGQGQQFNGKWVATAQNVAATCMRSNTSSSEDVAGVSCTSDLRCHELLQGQCQAVVLTMNVWFGVLLLGFCVLLLEQVSKWQYVQLHASQLAVQTSRNSSRSEVPRYGSSSPTGRANEVADRLKGFEAASRSQFIWQQLLRLHVVLDVPLLLLWWVFSSWLRPAAHVQ